MLQGGTPDMATLRRATRRRFASWLLAAFVAGVVVAPVLHDVSHVMEFRRQAELSRLAHLGHQHGERHVLEPSAVDDGTHLPCVLCHVRFSGVESARFDPSPDLPQLTVASEAPSVPQATLSQSQAIRGPPAVV